MNVSVNLSAINLKSIRFDVENEINNFLKALCNKIHISQVVLYGSIVNGNAHQWSDIDLCIVSDDFRRFSMIRRKNILMENAIKTGTLKIQSIGFTEREFDRAKYPKILNQIRKGKIIFPGHNKKIKREIQ